MTDVQGRAGGQQRLDYQRRCGTGQKVTLSHVTTESAKKFDASKSIVVPILSGGEKRCEVRFPTDAEWCAWARAQRTVRHFLGRGKSQSEELELLFVRRSPATIGLGEASRADALRSARTRAEVVAVPQLVDETRVSMVSAPVVVQGLAVGVLQAMVPLPAEISPACAWVIHGCPEIARPGAPEVSGYWAAGSSCRPPSCRRSSA